jgi:hypothetical protein
MEILKCVEREILLLCLMYMTTPQLQKACQFNCYNEAMNISHVNQEISILMIKRRQSKVNTSSSSQRESQRRKEKTENEGARNKKHESSMSKVPACLSLSFKSEKSQEKDLSTLLA